MCYGGRPKSHTFAMSANSYCPLRNAISLFRYIAQAMYLMLKEVHWALGPSDVPVHCIGHSLGAHACGFAGKHLVADPDRRYAKKLVRTK